MEHLFVFLGASWMNKKSKTGGKHSYFLVIVRFSIVILFHIRIFSELYNNRISESEVPTDPYAAQMPSTFG